MEHERDWWDKADIIGKIVSSVLLATITILLGYYTSEYQQNEDKKTADLKKIELIENMASDLSQPENAAKQDIALIALDNTVGKGKGYENDSAMVVKIVEHIFRNMSANIGSDTRKIALEIIEGRNPELANQIKAEETAKINDPATQITLVSPPNQSMNDEQTEPYKKDQTEILIPELQMKKSLMPKPPAFASTVAQKLSAVFSKICYIQIQNANEQDAAKGFQSLLQQNQWTAPGVEVREGNYKNSVRYFNDEDAAWATQVAEQANQFFNSCKTEFKAQKFSNFKAPKGQIEIWIENGCTGP